MGTATSPSTRHSDRRKGASAASKARLWARNARSPKKARRPASCRAARPSRKRRRNRRDSTRTGRKKPGLEAIQRPVRRQAAAGHDDMDMRMMGERRAPGVEDGGEADARAEMLGIGGDRGQRLGRRPEQEVVDGGLVLERDRADRRRQGEDDVIVGNRQEFGFALGEPLPG